MIARLAELLASHQALHEVVEHKRQALVANQLDTMAGYVNQESRLMKQIIEQDSQWKAAVQQFVATRGLKTNKSYTVTEIMGLVDRPSEREELKKLQSELLEVIVRIKQINVVNGRLINQSLDFFDYSLDLMGGGFEQETVYRNPAQSGKTAQGSPGWTRFDARG